MAFSKRTWKGRQGTGLNKFSINGATPVTVVNQPDSVTEQGDALSAGNLNDLEQRIADGFDSASGELADAVEELESADNDLKSAIDANSKRITNLEQKAGDEIVVNYPSQTYGMDGVPANVAEYAKVRELIMNSRVRNQLIEHGTFDIPNNNNGWSFNRCSWVSTTNNKMTVSANDSGSAKSIYRQPPIKPTGHMLLVTYTLTSSVATHCRAGIFGSQTLEESLSANTRTTFSEVLTPNYNADYAFLYFDTQSQMASGDTVVIEDFCITDLTKYFNGTIPSNASTIAEIQQNYPELLIHSDYDTGTMVDTTYSAVKSVGVNIWDEEWVIGALQSDGSVDSQSSRRTTSFIPIQPSTTYYQTAPSSAYNGRIAFYDINKNCVQYSSTGIIDGTFTSPNNAYWVRITVGASYGTTYNHDIQICLNSYTDKTTYHPYMESTLTLPSPVTGKSAGSVHQIYYPETGEMTEPISADQSMSDIGFGGYDSTTKTYVKTGGSWASPSSNDDVADILCSYYVPVSRNNLLNNDKCICINSAGAMIVRDTSFTGNGDTFNGTIRFALATPNPNSQATEPVLDPFVKVEGGGTIRPIQTQTTQIDSAMSVDYLGV